MSRAIPAAHHQPFVWRYLEERVRAYLAEGGIPGEEAHRVSREIILGCAQAADSIPREEIGPHAFDEAQIRLDSWLARRGNTLATAA